MVSNTRAVAAVIVTAVTCVTIQTILEMRRLKDLKPSIEQLVTDGVNTQWGEIFDSGWNAALSNRYAVKSAYDRLTVNN